MHAVPALAPLAFSFLWCQRWDGTTLLHQLSVLRCMLPACRPCSQTPARVVRSSVTPAARALCHPGQEYHLLPSFTSILSAALLLRPGVAT